MGIFDKLFGPPPVEKMEDVEDKILKYIVKNGGVINIKKSVGDLKLEPEVICEAMDRLEKNRKISLIASGSEKMIIACEGLNW